MRNTSTVSSKSIESEPLMGRRHEPAPTPWTDSARTSVPQEMLQRLATWREIWAQAEQGRHEKVRLLIGRLPSHVEQEEARGVLTLFAKKPRPALRNSVVCTTGKAVPQGNFQVTPPSSSRALEGMMIDVLNQAVYVGLEAACELFRTIGFTDQGVILVSLITPRSVTHLQDQLEAVGAKPSPSRTLSQSYCCDLARVLYRHRMKQYNFSCVYKK